VVRLLGRVAQLLLPLSWASSYMSGARDVGCRALSTDSLVTALREKLGVTVAPSQAYSCLPAALQEGALLCGRLLGCRVHALGSIATCPAMSLLACMPLQARAAMVAAFGDDAY
jgi:hypothetical protein